MSKMFRTEPFKGPLVRISYAHGLYTPRAADEGETPKHSVTLIIPNESLSAFQSKVAECVKGEWGDKGVEKFKSGMIKNPLLPGDSKAGRNKDGELKEGMGPDVTIIRPSAGADYPPAVFGKNGASCDPKEIKSGFWGYPVLNCFAWHNSKHGDGVGFGIDGWQHIKEDEILGGEGRDMGNFFNDETVDTSGDGGNDSSGAGGLFD